MPKQSLHLSDIKNCVHAAIITIRPDEYESVEKCLRNAISSRTLSITGGKNSYEYANLRTEDGNLVSVVVTRCVLQGNLSAQAVASNIITDLDPEWLLLVGIAGGIPGSLSSLEDY